jgi:hypothetical protein
LPLPFSSSSSSWSWFACSLLLVGVHHHCNWHKWFCFFKIDPLETSSIICSLEFKSRLICINLTLSKLCNNLIFFQ